MGRATPQGAADDRELDRIMSMTEDELIADCGGREAYEAQAADARALFERTVIEAERRTGKKYNGPKL